MKFILVIISVVLLLSFHTDCKAQNPKRIFKNIKSDNIEDAYKELSKFDTKKKYSSIELNELLLAETLILSNEKCVEYEPYGELEQFKKISVLNEDMPEIIKFLKNYGYSLQSISDILYERIFNFSKKGNTELSYKKALDVCCDCSYSSELKKLKELASYNECKAKDTEEGYMYFLNNYRNSLYEKEISFLLENKEFKESKKEITLNSLNKFIKKYPFSKFKKEAIDIRDSIALPKEPFTFNSINQYIKLYPKSKFVSKLKLELPNLLYNEVVSNESIDNIEQFTALFPNDDRVNELKIKLEDIYYNLLKKSFSLVVFNSFKLQFPNSRYISEFDFIISKLVGKSDLLNEGLKGNVKSIEISFHNGKIVREYNEFGKIKSIILNDNFNDKIEDFDMIYTPKEFNDEFLVILPFGRLKNTVSVDKGISISGITPENLNYVYDSEGKLLRVNNILFEYDNDGNLMEKKYLWDDNYLRNPDSRSALSKIKYRWKNGKLISKYAYNAIGDRYHEFYDIEYQGNKQIIRIITNNKDEPQETITLTRNTAGQIVNKTRVSHFNYFNGKPIRYYTRYSYDYKYSNGFIIKIGNTINVVRDKFGNILYIEKDDYNRNQYEHDTEWSYEYDEHHNWIKRTEYNVKIGDIKITKKTGDITRKITYY